MILSITMRHRDIQAVSRLIEIQLMDGKVNEWIVFQTPSNGVQCTPCAFVRLHLRDETSNL